MVKIRVKIGGFNYWVRIVNGVYRFEGLRNNGMGIHVKEAADFIQRLRLEYPDFFFKIDKYQSLQDKNSINHLNTPT
jgi:hypothetical protein